ncbi:MAG: SRPBCC domain-containing protein [Sphingomonas sp.]|nr:SRPBCC domain-containing protein [Sphingomonas sp.]
MDDVFDALAHPHRRFLLDSLFEQDGQTLGELERRLPVSRFAVMKQLRILEAAGLIASRKIGREKRHYLNPVPIRQISDRWIARYAAPFVGALVDLKSMAEQGSSPMTDPRHVYEIYIRASAEAVWAILTDDSKTPLYQHFDMTSRTDWRVGGAIEFFMGDRAVIVGELLELTPPSRLVMSFHARWSPDVAQDQPSRVVWEIAPLAGEGCKVTLVHDGFGGDTATSRQVGSGWPETLSRLKTLLETGKPFPIQPAYAAHAD